MQNLAQPRIRGDGLVQVDTDEWINRYNDCLKELGFPATKLHKFQIDSMGWSPEIAKEMNNIDYLAHGLANQYAIVLTNLQRHSPIFNPFHSFDWDMMKQLYNRYASQIELATRYEGICIEIDQRLDQYTRSEDLLLIDEIVVRLWTPSRIMEQAHNQKLLVREFMEKDDAHHDTNLILALQGSKEKIGDLRTKPLYIPDMEYTDIASFYTRVMGGWFVLRGQNSQTPLLISKEETTRAKGVDSKVDKKILHELEGLGLISYELERWLEKVFRLEIIRDSFLMDVLDELYPDLDYIHLSSPQQQSVRHNEDVQSRLPETYHMLNAVIKQLRHGQIPEKVPKKIWPYVAHPLISLPNYISEVVWYVLSMVCDGRSVVRFYRYDKDGFYNEFDTWKTPKQTWAVQCIERYYEYRMMKK